MERICKSSGHRNWLRKSGEECTCPKYVLASELEAAERERDALAAHVEQLNEVAASMDENSHDDVFHNLLQTLADGPETSLARQKLLWQAEALEKQRDRWDSKARECPGAFRRNIYTSVGTALGFEAKELRRQAEENNREPDQE